MSKISFLSDGDLSLRPLERGDLTKLRFWINDKDVIKYLGTYLPVSESGIERWFEKVNKEGSSDITLGIEVGGELIGNIGLHGIHPKNRNARIGIVIGENTHRGKGYGTKTMLLLLEYAFNTLNLRKVSLDVFSNNPRGIRCYQKCGFKEEGRLLEEYYVEGFYVDVIKMAIFRRDRLLKE